MSDAQLLDRFVSRRDEAAEAAFEELVIRHGPMVLQVCRNALHDAHDAEDAFQAVFLVLASRAGSIRRSGSIASWLFGVARRVATRARRGAARRRALDRRVAERTAESYLPPEDDPDREALHEEIDALPERLRAPIVLCYLQGMTYAAAAQQLGLSEMAIRGRLARARERLRRSLDPARRDDPGRPRRRLRGRRRPRRPSLPSLIHSTIRIALGFVAGHAAAVLAQGSAECHAAETAQSRDGPAGPRPRGQLLGLACPRRGGRRKRPGESRPEGPDRPGHQPGGPGHRRRRGPAQLHRSLRAHPDPSQGDRLHRQVEGGHRRQGEEGPGARDALRARAGRGLPDEAGDRRAGPGADRRGQARGGGGHGRCEGGRGAPQGGQVDPGQGPGPGPPLGLGGPEAHARGRSRRG